MRTHLYLGDRLHFSVIQNIAHPPRIADLFLAQRAVGFRYSRVSEIQQYCCAHFSYTRQE